MDCSQGMVAIMADREKLYRSFGPKLLEAIVIILKDEINELRQKVGLQEKTNQQMISSVEDKLKNIKDYNWMKKN